MQGLFISIVIIGISYFILKKRKVDFFSFSFIASVSYFSPGLLGFVQSVDRTGDLYPVAIGKETYYIYVMLLSIILLSAVLYDVFHKENTKTWNIPNNTIAIKLLYIFGFVIAFLFILLESDQLLATGKPSFGRIHILYQIVTGLSLACAIGYRKWKLTIIFFIIMLLDLYGGNREGLLLAVFAGMMFYFASLNKMRIIKYWKSLLGIIFIGLFLIGYKGIYVAVQAGNWDLVKFRITDGEYWINTLITMEPFATQNVLHQTIISDLEYSMMEWITPIFHNFIFYAPSLGAESNTFSSVFHDTLFPHVPWGMASNIWAESYAVGGILLVIVSILIYSSMAFMFNVLFYRTRGFLRLAITFSGIYFFFFIHRSGLNYTVTLQKRIILTMIAITLLTWFLTRVVNKKRLFDN